MPQPFAPEGCHKEHKEEFTKSTRKPTKGTKQKRKPVLCFVPFVGFLVLFVNLFDGYGFREISRLIDIATTSYCDVIGQQL